ncbi:unnamed protein product [Paramecium pentaurelia]|uniref:Uncharacterized protein n=1 Tax=Paramecium pentaurelia TaxID=43138 RepID=A0A8S1XJA9_9CILI|nr:unnamed protein product [Paramecium pentaurelia]
MLTVRLFMVEVQWKEKQFQQKINNSILILFKCEMIVNAKCCHFKNMKSLLTVPNENTLFIRAETYLAYGEFQYDNSADVKQISFPISCQVIFQIQFCFCYLRLDNSNI